VGNFSFLEMASAKTSGGIVKKCPGRRWRPGHPQILKLPAHRAGLPGKEVFFFDALL
jgi:hypothetical protein